MYVNKSLLRLKFINKRRNFYSKNLSFPFDKIFKLIKKNYPQKKVSIAGYYPSDYEVNVLDFLSKLNKNKNKVCLPVIKKNYKMDFKCWNPNEPLYINKYGILEPPKKNATLAPVIILVPLVSFDKNLNRIGYGRGYYDGVLKQLSAKKKILTIGLAFSFQECSFVPTNQHDYKLDCILTEKKLHYNKSNENFIFR